MTRHYGPICWLLLALLLMTSIPPRQLQAQTTRRCFSETGFCIEGRIREFWEQNGGLPVFGYPISLQQAETIEGKPLQTQWFERNRLELHPENDPPYDVLLGRLSEAMLEEQGRDWKSFEQTSPKQDCRYFEETGHNVCNDILATWQASGLQLDGHSSVSEEESLALFGLPLSEAQTETLDDGQEYTVQWFERARFELHTENEPPYHVLLGLLGVTMHDRATSGGSTPVTQEPVATGEAIDTTPFAFDLLQAVLKEDSNANVFISPTSIAFALAMTYNGADGATMQAMADVLDVQNMSLDDVNQGYAALMQAIQAADPEVKLTIANSLWARQGFDFEHDFLQRNRTFYSAEVSSLDFADPAATDTINAWVSDNTNGKIEQIVGQLDPLTVMVLINAIYFKGSWTTSFDEEMTSDRPFTLADGTEKDVPMMEQSGETYPYYEDEDVQAVSLPYGDGRISMYIFLPSEDSSLRAFQRRLNAKQWEEWMQNFSDEEGDIVLPRFKLEYEKELNDVLAALGMDVAFDCNQADFSRMYSKEPLCISKVKHKSFVEVNEEGTEAAAATSVEMTLSAMPMQGFSMIVDRPFFFAIRDNETGAVLFMGSVVEP